MENSSKHQEQLEGLVLECHFTACYNVAHDFNVGVRQSALVGAQMNHFDVHCVMTFLAREALTVHCRDGTTERVYRGLLRRLRALQGELL